jgi:hypothetical protein
MLSRSILTIAVVVGAWSGCALSAYASPLYAQLFPFTGEVRLLNRSAVPAPFTYYSITSASGALDGSNEVWRSVAEYYDQSGSGLIDPAHEWFKLAAQSTELTEGVFTGPGGSLPATRAVSLGTIWNPLASPFPDLSFDVLDPFGQPIGVTLELAIAGDYTGDGVVDQADYVLWRRDFGSTTSLLADGNLNGVVDTGDFLIWRQNYGSVVPLPPYVAVPGSGSLAALNAVPEPGAAAMAIAGVAFLTLGARRRAHRSLCALLKPF